MILAFFLFIIPLCMLAEFIWAIAFSVLVNVPWRSYWTYAAIFVLALMFELPGLLIPCIILGGLTWYFSPEQTRHREIAERERIRANAHYESKMEYEKRRQARRDTRKHQAYTVAHKRKHEQAMLYQRINTKKAEKNNLTSQIINLTNVARSLNNDKQSRAEANRLHNEIANLKARKITLSEIINNLYLDLYKTKNPAQ